MNSDVAGVEKVDSLEVGQRILCGNRWVRVSQDLADAFSVVEQRVRTRAFFPGGVTNYSEPSGRTLRALD